MSTWYFQIPPLTEGEVDALISALANSGSMIEEAPDQHEYATKGPRGRAYLRMEEKVSWRKRFRPTPRTTEVRFTVGEIRRLIQAGKIGAWGGNDINWKLESALDKLKTEGVVV